MAYICGSGENACSMAHARSVVLVCMCRTAIRARIETGRKWFLFKEMITLLEMLYDYFCDD